MKKKIGCILAAALLLTGCGKIPTLENGQEAVVTFENGNKISVDELYEKMKDTYALQTLITMIDTEVLNTTFEDYKKDAEEATESYMKSILANYDSEDEFVELLQSYYGISSIDAYKEYIYLSYMQSHAAEEYAKLQVEDDDIEDYYENNIVGDIEVSHILIVPVVTDEMTDEEIEAAETEAEEKANNLLAELKETKSADLAAKFKELAEENSDDDSTSTDGGALGKINKIGDNYLGDSYDEVTDAAYNTKDGAIYAKVVKSEVGYHIVYRTKSYDKADLKEVKDDIIETLANDIMDNDSTISVKALQYYRKEAGMEIQDSELQTQYAYYIQNSLNTDSEE